MRVYYEFSNLNNTEAKITRITPATRFEGNFVEIADELGKKFMEGREISSDWKLVWDTVSESMVMTRIGVEAFNSLMSAFLEVTEKEDPDVIIKVVHPSPSGGSMLFLVSMYEPPEDPNMPLYFFITKKGDPNVLYAEFMSHYYEVENKFHWHDPRDEFSVFTKGTNLVCSLEVDNDE